MFTYIIVFIIVYGSQTNLNYRISQHNNIYIQTYIHMLLGLRMQIHTYTDVRKNWAENNVIINFLVTWQNAK